MMLACRGLNKAFDGQCVLEDVNLAVDRGDFLAVLGRSGCGKTTLLRMLGGFLTPDSGEIWLNGRRVIKPDKDRWMVFQGFRQLFPWLTLRQNILYSLKKARPTLSKGEARELALQSLVEMDLLDAAEKYPHQLSGGMAQRGAFARAMALAPKVLLLDEPFSSLDVYSRENARNALLKLKKVTGAAVVFVTHDIGEAVAIAPRIAVMSPECRGIGEWIDNANTDGATARARRLMGLSDRF